MRKTFVFAGVLQTALAQAGEVGFKEDSIVLPTNAPDGYANHPEWLKRDPNHVNP